MNVHFLSGLPRSGSTLLAALLRQNPRFRAGLSPLGGLVPAMLEAMSRKYEAAPLVDDAQRIALLRGLFTSYHGDAAVVIDTHRIWCAKLPLLAALFPDCRVICTVRHVGWIMDSVERLVRRNPTHLSGLFDFDSGGTVYSRTNALARGDSLVGFALDALKEAYYGEQAHRLLLVDYDALAREPMGALEMVYRHIGETWYDGHDPEAVEYAADEFDAALGTPGLHDVRRRVEYAERETCLPPAVFGRYEGDSFWRDPRQNTRGVPVLLHREMRHRR